MSLSTLMLRNLGKVKGVDLLKSARLTPIKSYTTVVATQRYLTSKPLNLLKNVNQQLSTRNISLSAPRMAAAGGSHTAIWTLERVLSASMLATLPAAFLFPSQAMDALLAISLVLHSHWGIEAMVTDYLRPNVVGNVVPKVAHISLLLISVATLGGLFYLIHNDIGIAESVKKLWTVKSGSSEAAE